MSGGESGGYGVLDRGCVRAKLAPSRGESLVVSERIQRQIDRLLDEAEEAASELDWAVVRDRATAVLAYQSENPDALAHLAAAEKALESVVRPSPTATVTVQPPSAPTEPQPTSFADGRYQVRSFLGEEARSESTWPTTSCWIETWHLR